MSSKNNAELVKVMEKLDGITGMAQVVGCWLYLEAADGWNGTELRDAVEVMFLADCTFHVQFENAFWAEDGSLSRVVVNHANAPTVTDLESVLVQFFAA